MNSKGLVAIFLAAGKSSRMGENKLALPLGMATVGSSALKTALNSKLDHIIVVTRQDDPLQWLEGSFFQSPLQEKWSHCPCRDSDKGQAHSLKCGLQAAIAMKAKGMMVLLGDQPFLLEETINQLIFYSDQESLMKENPSYIATSYKGMPRPPILFFPDFVPSLLKLEGDEGARHLLRGSSFIKKLLIEMDNDKNFMDIDTKEDYETAVKGVEQNDE